MNNKYIFHQTDIDQDTEIHTKWYALSIVCRQF